MAGAQKHRLQRVKHCSMHERKRAFVTNSLQAQVFADTPFGAIRHEGVRTASRCSISAAPMTFCEAQSAARFAPIEPSTAHSTSIALIVVRL